MYYKYNRVFTSYFYVRLTGKNEKFIKYNYYIGSKVNDNIYTYFLTINKKIIVIINKNHISMIS